MKIVLSRKGFDSSIGKVPSPILPDGTLISLPIPQTEPMGRSRRQFREVHTPYGNLGTIVEELSTGKISSCAHVHLDPDLEVNSIPRLTGWRPLFGQAGAAERHLQNQGVGPGDIFLFFGWFREVENRRGQLRYRPHGMDKHVLFGWLQIEQRFASDDMVGLPDWAQDHPHYGRSSKTTPDSIYLSAEQLHVPGHKLDLPGSGTFRKYSNRLLLSDPGLSTRSVWRLPSWFLPSDARPSLTYHTNEERWSRGQDYVQLRSVGRGQEFVLNCDLYPQAMQWALDLIKSSI